MTSWIVIDSSVLIASLVEETYSTQARAIFHWAAAHRVSVAAPALLIYESVSTVRKLVHRTALTSSEGIELIELILSRPIHLVFEPSLSRRAFELAEMLGLAATYDAQYLAVAEYLASPFWTLDQKLFRSVGEQFSWIKDATTFEVQLN
jgi:predicted nucleic acid-binding protein